MSNLLQGKTHFYNRCNGSAQEMVEGESFANFGNVFYVPPSSRLLTSYTFSIHLWSIQSSGFVGRACKIPSWRCFGWLSVAHILLMLLHREGELMVGLDAIAISGLSIPRLLIHDSAELVHL
jgi:hypothetical protein